MPVNCKKQMSIKAYLLITIVAIFNFCNVNSQTPPVTTLNIFKQLTTSKGNEGKIHIQQDEALSRLMLQYIEYRRKEAKIPGYRIRIFSDSGQTARQRAFTERARFSQINPEMSTYLEYEQPNFKIYVGDFRSRGEAYRFYKQIVKEFPKAFPVPTRINLPKI